MLDFIAFVILCYVLYRLRGYILNGAKWVRTKLVIICKLPVVFVKCLFASIVAKEVRKQLWTKEAEEFAKRNQ